MQVDRLFEIMYLLLERQSVPARELAERLEISTRTVYRDVEKLSQAGMPIYATRGKGGGIALLPDFVLNKAALSREEKQHIVASVRAFASLQPGGMGRMPSKLAAMLDDGAADWIEVDFSSWSHPEEERKRFELLRRAILERRAVRFLYANARGERRPRTVEPLKLGFKSQAWYLFAHCRLREEERFFKLSRMNGLELLEETFQREAPARIFPDGNVFQEAYIRLRLRLSPAVSFRAYEEFSTVEEQPDGGFLVACDYPMGVWLFEYIASFGAACEVLGPEEVRAAYADEIQKISRMYAEYDKQVSDSVRYAVGINHEKREPMQYEIVTLPEKTIVGVSTSTSNSDPEMGKKIGDLWVRLYQGGVHERIRNKINERAIGLYSDYAGEDYLVTAGNEVSQPENGDLAVKTIPAGRYAKFSVHGHMERAVGEAWAEIWKMDLPRSYTGDFEEYMNDNMEDADIDIYIALK